MKCIVCEENEVKNGKICDECIEKSSVEGIQKDINWVQYAERYHYYRYPDKPARPKFPDGFPESYLDDYNLMKTLLSYRTLGGVIRVWDDNIFDINPVVVSGFQDKLDWDKASLSPELLNNTDFVWELLPFFNWKKISLRNDLTEDFIRSFWINLNAIDITELYIDKDWFDWSFIDENKDDLHWTVITREKSMTPELIEKYKVYLDWRVLTNKIFDSYDKTKYDEYDIFLKDYLDYIDFDTLTVTLGWKHPILQEHERLLKLSWHYILTHKITEDEIVEHAGYIFSNRMTLWLPDKLNSFMTDLPEYVNRGRDKSNLVSFSETFEFKFALGANDFEFVEFYKDGFVCKANETFHKGLNYIEIKADWKYKEFNEWLTDRRYYLSCYGDIKAVDESFKTVRRFKSSTLNRDWLEILVSMIEDEHDFISKSTIIISLCIISKYRDVETDIEAYKVIDEVVQKIHSWSQSKTYLVFRKLNGGF